MCIDALHRTESCGSHFREESQTPDGEALRDDEHFAHVAAWEYTDRLAEPNLHREPLHFEYVHLRRSEEHTSELQSQSNLVCRLLLEKKHPPRRARSAPPARP